MDRFAHPEAGGLLPQAAGEHGYLASAHFAVDSSSGAVVNLGTTDDFTRLVVALACYTNRELRG